MKEDISSGDIANIKIRKSLRGIIDSEFDRESVTHLLFTKEEFLPEMCFKQNIARPKTDLLRTVLVNRIF